MSKFIRMRQLRPCATASIIKQNFGTKLAPTKLHLTETEVAELKSVPKEVLDYLTNLDQFKGVTPLRDFYKNMIEYNVEPSYLGCWIIDSYKKLAKQADLTEENIKLVNVLTWCTNAFVGAGIILDDMLDSSSVRRGKPAWHKLDNVGLEAANHSLMVLQSINLVLSKYFPDAKKCIFLMEIFKGCCFTACAGQMLENILIKDGKPQFEFFTSELYRKLTDLKGGNSFFRCHLAIIFALTNNVNKDHETSIAAISQKLGLVLQANNDFRGCFTKQVEKEKGNTDISKGKCTWLVVEALQQANPAQKKIIENHYGRPGAEAEIAVRNVYLELELPKQYEQFEKETLNDCAEFVRNHPDKEIRDALFIVETARIRARQKASELN